MNECPSLPLPCLPMPAEAGSAWGEGSEGSGEWDGEAPWRPWAAQADPVGCLELDLVWRFPSAAAALQAHAGGGEAAPSEAAPAGLAPAEASEWRLLALGDAYERDTGHRGFVLRPGKRPGPPLQSWPACVGCPVQGHTCSTSPAAARPPCNPRQCSGQAAPLPAAAVGRGAARAAHPGGLCGGGAVGAARGLFLLRHAAQAAGELQVRDTSACFCQPVCAV